MANKPYERVKFRGHTLNRRTIAMINQAEDVLLKGFELDVLQGSYNGGSGKVEASAGTHDGGGAVDFAWPGGSRARAQEVAWALRQVGFAAWVREDLPGVWDHHIHAIAIGDKEMSAGAAKQVQDYYHDLDGLAGWWQNGKYVHRADKTRKPNPIPVFGYPLGVLNIDVAVAQAKAKRKTSKPAVKIIQRSLNAKSGTHLATDGIWGPKTREAVKRWELQHGGDGDGIPGAPTMKLLGLGRFRVQ